METNEMSSEVTDKQELTQEALDAASTEEKTPAETEPTVPLHVHTALRTRAQDAEVAKARAEGKLEAMQQQNVRTATVSPLDAEIARQREEGIDEEDMQISPAVMKADKLYERNQAALAAETSAKQQLGMTQVASMNTAKVVHDDWQDVVNAGQTLLTDGESIDVAAAGNDFGEIAYAKCKAAIERNKPVKKETEAAPEKKLSKSEADKKAAEEAEAKKKEAASQEELLKDKVKSDNPAIDAKMRL